MQTITTSENTLRQLRQIAASRGQDSDVLAEELLEVSLAALDVKDSGPPETRKPFHAMEFRGIAPTNRTAAEIDAEIESGRKISETPFDIHPSQCYNACGALESLGHKARNLVRTVAVTQTNPLGPNI